MNIKFKNWTPETLKEWVEGLPSSPLINPRNKIKLRGEIHVENYEPKDGSELWWYLEKPACRPEPPKEAGT